MAEYIDREQAEIMAIDGVDKWDGGYNYERELAIQEAIRRIPSADVVEVVRCKNCVYWDNASNWTPECRRLDGLSSPNEDDFCSYGTPKERGGEK